MPCSRWMPETPVPVPISTTALASVAAASRRRVAPVPGETGRTPASRARARARISASSSATKASANAQLACRLPVIALSCPRDGCSPLGDCIRCGREPGDGTSRWEVRQMVENEGRADGLGTYPELTGEVDMVGALLDTTRADRGGAAAAGHRGVLSRFRRSAYEPKSVTDTADDRPRSDESSTVAATNATFATDGVLRRGPLPRGRRSSVPTVPGSTVSPTA